MEDRQNEEEITKRHKQERKELQAKILSMKKSIPKGDKKKKKDVTEEIDRMQREQDEKHATELQALRPDSGDAPDASSDMEIPPEPQPEEDEEEVTANVPRISRAAKRRNKKAQDEREREKRILEQDEKNREGPRVVEMSAIKDVLKQQGLQLHNVPADGNCLYCAINHQLEITGRETYTVKKLRKLTSEFMKENRDEFLPFMYDESDETVGEDYFEEYCKDVANTKLWGGQLELRALSNILTCPIKVIQASGPPTLQGENFKGPELTLTYHRHLYRLGEHYNSTIALKEADDNE